MSWHADGIKYCLLSWNDLECQETEYHRGRKVPISGLFNWANVLAGASAFPRSQEEMSKFNLIHLNVTAENLNLIPKIVRLVDRTKTKLIFNVDYAIELWPRNFRHPELFLQQLNQADFIFAVEEKMAEILSLALHRTVPCIPHPTDTVGLKETYFSAERDNQIGVAIHQYDGAVTAPFYALREQNHFQTVAFGGISKPEDYYHLFDFIAPYRSFEDNMKMVSRLFAIVESYTIHSYGRVSVEAAALGIPVIGSTIVGSIKRCFPETSFDDPMDALHIIKHIVQLQNPAFYRHVSQKAMKEADYYSFENSRRRMIKFITEEQS